MATVTAYAEAYDAYIIASDATYQNAREGTSATLNTGSTVVYVGQTYTSTPSYACYQAPVSFDTSAAVGTILSATLTLTPDSLTSVYVDFDLEARAYDFGATVEAADWRNGSALSALPLYGSKATSAMVAGTSFDMTVTALANTAAAANVRVVLTSSRHKDGTAPSTNPALRLERVDIRASEYAGTTSDPKLVIEDFSGPSLCTIVAPTEGYSYATASVISLTANATDPTPDTVRFHWDYSYQGGAWTACPNSPSGYVASGANASINFDIGGLAGFGSIAFRVRAFDGTNYSLAYTQVVTVYTSQQSGLTLYRSDGAIAVANPVSGVIIRRPLSAPATLSFAVDNFDATEAAIADDDDLVLTVNTHEGSTYQFRGQVTRKTVGDIMEIEAQDIARTFDRLPVTRILTGRKLGALIKDVIENPTGSDPTGIIATCDEFDDPLNPGNDLVVDIFVGEGRTISQWLALARDWTGYEWYCEYSSGSWRFHWFNPAGNSAWAVAVRDRLNYGTDPGYLAGLSVAPTTDSGWATYSEGSRLFLPAATNYPTNPTANAGAWSVDSPLVSTKELSPPVAFPEGIASCNKLVHSSGSYLTCYPSPYPTAITVAEGEVWILSAYVHCSALSGDVLYVAGQTNLRVWYEASVYFAVSATNSDFVRFAKTITISAGETTLIPLIVVATGTGTYYVTGLSAVKEPTLTPYFDGSYDDCAWTGTADASTSTRTASSLILTDYVSIDSTGETAAGTKVAYVKNPSATYYGPGVITDTAKSAGWQSDFAAESDLDVIWGTLTEGDLLLPTVSDGVGWVKGLDYESSTRAVVLSSPTKLVDRSQYANRVNYYETTPNPGLPASTSSFDSLYSESATGWTAESPATVAASSTQTTTGTYAIRGQRVYSSAGGSIYLYLALNALHWDWTAEGFGYLSADVYVDATTAVGDGAYVGAVAISGTFDGSYGAGDPVRGFPLGEASVVYNSNAIFGVNRLSMWNQFTWDLSASFDENAFDPQDVQTLVFLFSPAPGTTLTETINVYFDNIRFRPRTGEPESYWRETYVETAAVTAGTEKPLTAYADTRGLNFLTSASLAKNYLTQLSTPRETINTVDVSGIRGSVTMESDVTLTLTTRDISAVAYPVAAIEYHLMDRGDLTRLTLGKREQDVLAGIQKLVQRVQQIDAGFRLV